MSDETFSIEPASAADIARLTPIADECGLNVDFPAELARSYALLRVARQGPEICGFLLAWRAADELHLTDLGVRGTSRRRGVGRALVAELCHEGRLSDARVVVLEVRASNEPALALYHRLHFVEQGRRSRYYADTDEDAVVMQLELR
ncbi:MAG TPA: ribosomal protein S18-alanine N-acetyltransferase [Polyangiaceae bacterium]|nr:ribosomal protein S18-alanine N-acetyltransferase [Polyangiaceae bacterium]